MAAVTVREPLASRAQGTAGPGPSPSTKLRTLDDLSALEASQARAAYETARVPVLGELRGDYRGRILALEGTAHGGLARAWRAVTASRLFPWRGKAFAPLSDRHGKGVNLLFGDTQPRRSYPFETSLARSRAGAFDALQIDYDLPDNPFFVRAVRDELREVAPGLYLGQAYVLTPRRARLVLYFGLQRQA